MGQMFYGTDIWPTWPIHICWPIWPTDPLSALVSLPYSYQGGPKITLIYFNSLLYFPILTFSVAIRDGLGVYVHSYIHHNALNCVVSQFSKWIIDIVYFDEQNITFAQHSKHVCRPNLFL